NIHDDGIDEKSLTRLAEETEGRYYHARDASKIQLAYDSIAREIQDTWIVSFRSNRPTHDGTARGIDVYVERKGKRISDVASVDYNVHGVVVPEWDRAVYLPLLGVLGGLIFLPAALRRLRLMGGA